MLVNLQEVLKEAEKKHAAVGSFNTPNLETVLGVVEAAEKMGVPVVLMHAEVHEAIQPIEVIAPIMLRAAEKASVPVCVHLDHGEHYAYIKKAIELGFSSVMFDGSRLSYEKNLQETQDVIDLAHQTGVSVEGELGVIEREVKQIPSRYTDPADAAAFVRAVPLDALACAFGTAHGIYQETPRLDFKRLQEIHQHVAIPLVMHGGSGVSLDDYRQAIQNGIRKINYYTYMAKYTGEYVRDKLLSYKGIPYYHDISGWAKLAVGMHVEHVMRVFWHQEG